MIELSFKQTSSELMVRASATILFNSVVRCGFPFKLLSELSQDTQYGYTASASQEVDGIKFVRITDLKDGKINWDTVPYCKCDSPDQYMLEVGDILFARTGATTGKTHLVRESPKAVFASYLIRLRPQKNILADYLYYFFQSDTYWKQIIEEKEGSAQPNVNGKKLIKINIPLVPYELQVAISSFLAAVRLRQDGILQDLPELPPPLEEQRRIVERIEELETAIGEARRLRSEIETDTHKMLLAVYMNIIQDVPWRPMKEVAPLVRRRVEIDVDNSYPELGVRSFGKGTFHKPSLSGFDVGTKKLFSIEPDDLVFQIVFAWEGAVAVAKSEDKGRVGSHRFLTCVPRKGISLSSFLCFHFL